MNILVRNLATLVTEEKLVAYFRQFGTVDSVSIVRVNRKKEWDKKNK